MSERRVLGRAAELGIAYVESVPDRPVRPSATVSELRRALDEPLPEGPTEPLEVVEELARVAEPGLAPMGSGRYFGFVIGGALPAALAADWLTAAWDQNAGLALPTPAAAVVEEVAGRWLKEVLGIPAGASFALVTGCQMAHATALAAARNHVLALAGHDVERQGLAACPPIRIVAGANRHGTIDRALRLLGFGTDSVRAVPIDDRGRMDAEALAEELARRARPDDRLRPARRRQHRRLRRPGRRGGCSRRRRGVAARRRRLRPLGRRLAGPPPPDRRQRAGRLVGHRRPQVAQRAVRQRDRVLRASRGAPGGARDPLRLPRPRRPRHGA